MHWQADIHVTLPNGEFLRERRMAQGSTKAAALPWAKAREAHLLRHGKEERKDKNKRTPTLGEFVDQFRRDYLIANRWRPSTLYGWDSVLARRLIPVLGDKRFDEIGPREVQLIFERNRIHVCVNDFRGHVGPPKGGRDRWVPMTKQLRRALEVMERRSERVLWRGEDAAPLSATVLAYRVHKAMSRVGLGKKGPHTLRHTFCSHLAMRGVSRQATDDEDLHALGTQYPRRRDRGPREVVVDAGTTTEPR